MMKKISIVLSSILLFGCMTLATEKRKDAFNLSQEGFYYLPRIKKTLTIRIKELTVNIVPEMTKPLGGLAIPPATIVLEGRQIKGQIIINQAILGHELMHILRFKNERIAHPDKLDELGAHIHSK